MARCDRARPGQDGRVEADGFALLGVALGALVLAGTVFARRTGIPEPVVLLAVGLAASALPSSTAIELPPDLVFLVFLPPLLFRASFLTSPRTLRENATPLALLSVGLVLATAFGVAAVVTVVVPGLGFAEGLVLGAVVAPTDPVAAAAVFRRLGAPRRVTDLVEGESLINDATALVLLAIAIEVVIDGPPTPGAALRELVVTIVGGIAFGVVVARAVMALRGRLSEDVGIQLLLSLLVPFVAYVPADAVHASGVLAVVTTGVLLGGGTDGAFSAATRLPAMAFWSLLDLILNAFLFVLLGLQVRQILEQIPDLTTGQLAVSGLAVVLVVAGLRLAWQFVIPPALYWLRRRAGRPAGRSSAGERLLIGWTGMRGAVSLAAALSIPLQGNDGPFPGRPLILFLTVAVVLASLLIQGITLPYVLTRTGLAGGEDTTEEEREARLALADVALTRLTELERDGSLPHGASEPLRQLWEHTRARIDPDENPDHDLTEARLAVTVAQRAELARRREDGSLPPEVARALREELDLQQVRLDSETPGGRPGLGRSGHA